MYETVYKKKKRREEGRRKEPSNKPSWPGTNFKKKQRDERHGEKEGKIKRL